MKTNFIRISLIVCRWKRCDTPDMNNSVFQIDGFNRLDTQLLSSASSLMISMPVRSVFRIEYGWLMLVLSPQ